MRRGQGSIAELELIDAAQGKLDSSRAVTLQPVASGVQPTVKTVQPVIEAVPQGRVICRVEKFDVPRGYGRVKLPTGQMARMAASKINELSCLNLPEGALISCTLEVVASDLRVKKVYAIDWSEVGVVPTYESSTLKWTNVGRVKSFNSTEGYGFVDYDQARGGGYFPDVFVHITVCETSGLPEGLVEGQVVEVDYTIQNGKPRAFSVRLVPK